MNADSYASERIDALFASIDGGDTKTFTEFLTEDASFRFGSAPTLVGRAQIFAGVNAFFASIAACSHSVSKSIGSGSTLVCEGTVTYSRHDGSKVSIPFVNVLELSGDLISEYKIYIDIGPLFAS